MNALDRENIFGIDIDIRLQHSAQEILTWCATIKPALKKAMKEFKEEMRKGQTKIPDFIDEKSDADNQKPKKNKRISRQHSSGPAQSSTHNDTNHPT